MKRRLNHKLIKASPIKAFTLIEIVVVLIISTTVMTLAMWSYGNISKYLRTYSNQENLNQELALFLTHFRADVDESLLITEKNGTLELHDFKDELITYDFYEEYAIRYFYGYPDTFKVNTMDFTYIQEPFNKEWIGEIHLTVKASGVEYPFTFYKFYTNQQLFQAHEY
ncbi:MAG: type II secretion system protein [Salinivirgaceae bacterium]